MHGVLKPLNNYLCRLLLLICFMYHMCLTFLPFFFVLVLFDSVDSSGDRAASVEIHGTKTCIRSCEKVSEICRVHDYVGQVAAR
jgi:hypothetical protein